MKQQHRTRLPMGLEHFDDLPDSAYVRGTVVDGLMGYSRWTRSRRVKDGSLPAPEQTSPGVHGFNVGKIRAVLAKVAEPE